MKNGKDRTEYAKRVVIARERAKLTQPELAKKAGMSQTAVAEAETVRDGSTYTAQIANVCGVRAMWLATGEGPMLESALWPFTRVALADVLRLSEADRGFVEGELSAAMRQCSASGLSEIPKEESPPHANTGPSNPSVAGTKGVRRRFNSQVTGAGGGNGGAGEVNQSGELQKAGSRRSTKGAANRR